ncbi:MAG TPA: hypothetical protein HPP97_09740 [Desulfuromonadales bacterium]|nr:hypothetical protein [Desulfuromonadales bacterium]
MKVWTFILCGIILFCAFPSFATSKEANNLSTSLTECNKALAIVKKTLNNLDFNNLKAVSIDKKTVNRINFSKQIVNKSIENSQKHINQINKKPTKTATTNLLTELNNVRDNLLALSEYLLTIPKNSQFRLVSIGWNNQIQATYIPIITAIDNLEGSTYEYWK